MARYSVGRERSKPNRFIISVVKGNSTVSREQRVSGPLLKIRVYSRGIRGPKRLCYCFSDHQITAIPLLSPVTFF